MLETREGIRTPSHSCNPHNPPSDKSTSMTIAKSSMRIIRCQSTRSEMRVRPVGPNPEVPEPRDPTYTPNSIVVRRRSPKARRLVSMTSSLPNWERRPTTITKHHSSNH